MTDSCPKHDICSIADIDQLVEHFYNSMLTDPIVGFFFTDIANIDLQQHLPIISKFWQRQLLGHNVYQGRTFEIHQQLHQRAELTEHHFHRWLHLFESSIDQHFEGAVAETAKLRARSIARSMLQGLQQRHMTDVLQSRELQGVQAFDPSETNS